MTDPALSRRSLSVWRHWLIAALLAVFAAALAWHWTLVRAPHFLMSRAMDRVAGAGEWNAMQFAPLATDEARTIVRPSPDLAYAICAYDVAQGPVVVEAYPVPSPYYSLSVYGANTDALFVRNARQAAGQPIKIALVRPGTAAPAGYEAVTVPANRGIALIRTLVPDRGAFPAIDQARRLSNCRSLART